MMLFLYYPISLDKPQVSTTSYPAKNDCVLLQWFITEIEEEEATMERRGIDESSLGSRCG